MPVPKLDIRCHVPQAIYPMPLRNFSTPWKALLVSTSLCGFVFAGQPVSEKTWTGVNGKSFRGTFVRLSEDKSTVEIATPQGKILKVAFTNLIKMDQEYVLDPSGKAAPDKETTAREARGFKQLPAPDRALYLPLKPKDYQVEEEEAMVDALWVSLLWWDLTSQVSVPKSGDLDAKARWLHKQLVRKVAQPGRDVASLEEGAAGIIAYFNEELKETATCKTETIAIKELTPARVSEQCTGANVVILKMTMTYSNNRDFSTCLALESMDASGKFTAIAFGKRLPGRMVEANGSGKDGKKIYNIQWDNPDTLPEHYLKNGAQFHMGPSSWNGALVLKPFIYQLPGEETAIPDPGTVETPVKPAAPAWEYPKIKVRPEKPVPFTGKWILKDGRELLGTATAAENGKIVLENTGGARAVVTETELTPESLVMFRFQEGTATTVSLPHLDLTYRLNTPVRGAIEFLVSTDGTLGRVDYPDQLSTIIYDMADGAFIWTRYRDVNGEKKLVTREVGRFAQQALLPHELPGDGADELVEQFTEKAMNRRDPSRQLSFPGRSLRYPFPAWQASVEDMTMDHVLIEEPTALAGVFIFLSSPTPDPKGGTGVYYHKGDTSGHGGFKQKMNLLSRARVFPLRIRWDNGGSVTTDGMVTRESMGKFSVELIKATIREKFDPGHFEIPEESRVAKPGTSVRKG